MSSASSSCDAWTGLEGAEPGPVPCGLLWYTHVGKTGGETVKNHLHLRARTQKWGFRDLYMPMEPPELHLPYRWEMTKATQSLLNALNKSKPRIIVHQHSGYSGVGEYMLDRWFRPLATRFRNSAIEKDCRVVLTTTIREPVVRVLSHSFWAHAYGWKDAHNDAAFETFAREQSNFQTKYALFADDWRVKALTSGDDAFDATLLQPALATLRHFDLVGRTEELQAFRNAIDNRMGWPPLQTEPELTHSGIARLKPSERAMAAARRYNAIDAQLYGSFCRRNSSHGHNGHNGHSNGHNGHHHRPRVVQPLWDIESAPPYRFPRYWTNVKHNDSKVKITCEQNVGACAWTLLPAHDGRACRAGSSATLPPEAWVTCDSDGMATPRSTLAPYARNKSQVKWPKDPRGRPRSAEEATMRAEGEMKALGRR